MGVSLGAGGQLPVLAAARLVLVLGVVLLVLFAQPLCFLDERPLVALIQESGRRRHGQSHYLVRILKNGVVCVELVTGVKV